MMGIRDIDDFKYPNVIFLPCGNLGINEQAICGYPSYRCDTCMAVFGSIACPCNHLEEKPKKEKS